VKQTKQVDETKKHIEKLAATNRRFASELETSRRIADAVRHDRTRLRARVSEVELELGAIHDRLEESRRKTKLLLEERRSLRQEVVASRGQLARSHARLSALAEQLDQVTQERDAVYAELEEATCALVDIREQLRASLENAHTRSATEDPVDESFSATMSVD